MKYKILGKSGLRVSELCFGTMTFGMEWGYGADKSESRKLFTSFCEAGGNFFDTANRYTEGSSELWLGEFVRENRCRDEVVLATKYSLFTGAGKINDGGNHRKNLVQSVEGSLKRMGTEYIDILYIHAWDFTVDEEELMRNLNYLLADGKVLHIAISDSPAWKAARCNSIAAFRGWQPFTAFQAEYSLITRDVERDIIPLCEADAMPLLAWGALGGGALTGKYLGKTPESGRVKPDSKRRNEKSVAIAEVVQRIAKQKEIPAPAVALRWLMQGKVPVIPIIGARNADQLSQNMHATSIELSVEEMETLNAVSSLELGWPHDFLRSEQVMHVLHGGLAESIDLQLPTHK
jgi:aryl-alcohol dehydrogenase-like predicted oxidoreductase